MTDEAFTTGMMVLQEIFPKDLSPEAVQIYRTACDQLSDDVWLAAVEHCARKVRFFPVPAELMLAAGSIVAKAHGVQPSADAWLHVHAIARYWYDGQGVRDRFDPLEWDALQAVGGIRAVAHAEEGAGIGQLERQFRAAYDRRLSSATDTLLSESLPRAIVHASLTEGAQR